MIVLANCVFAAHSTNRNIPSLEEESSDNKIFFVFDALYWKSKVDGVQYTYSVKDIISPTSSIVSIKEPKFDWTFAFKVGLGYNLPKQGWDVKALYTYFRDEASNHSHVTSPGALVPVNPTTFNITTNDLIFPFTDTALFTNDNAFHYFFAKFATSSVGCAKIHLDDLIVNLRGMLFSSKNTSLQPSIGLKATWITLRTNYKWWGGDSLTWEYVIPGGFIGGFSQLILDGLGNHLVTALQKQTLFGLGPIASLDASWSLGHNISLYSSLSGALLYGYFNIKEKVTYSAYPANLLQTSDQFHRFVPTVDFDVGFMYEKYSSSDHRLFSISLSYETQYFWQISYLGTITATPGGLSIHGASLNLCVDF